MAAWDPKVGEMGDEVTGWWSKVGEVTGGGVSSGAAIQVGDVRSRRQLRNFIMNLLVRNSPR